ncbi:MAG TPA: NAD(P)H-quinone oxidoreductase [Polyangiaceae bacterium]|nr:NAD(P)H-quinone oxidoreductase [Polyangiaceae bacterium]
MKAIVIVEPGGPEKLELREVTAPAVRDGYVLVDVKATALNRADLLQRRGFYPPPKGETDILGLECAGVVAELGAGVSSVAPGDRVMALLPGGGYAERVLVPEKMLIPVPATLSFEQAAAVPEAFLVAREALFTLGRLRANDVVLIHASAGGVGSAAVQLAKQTGARVVATAGSDDKLAWVAALGADVVVNYKSGDFVDAVKKLSDGKGADVVLDFVGASYWQKHASCLSIGGRVISIGVLGGASAEVNFAQLMSRRYQLLGLVMRSRDVSEKIVVTQAFIRETLPFIASGALKPLIDSVFPLADAVKAHERMEANLNLGKIVLAV